MHLFALSAKGTEFNPLLHNMKGMEVFLIKHVQIVLVRLLVGA